MESKIASTIRLELEPVALVWADEKSAGAMEFMPGKWGCVLFLLAAATKGEDGGRQPRNVRLFRWRGRSGVRRPVQELPEHSFFQNEKCPLCRGFEGNLITIGQAVP